MYEMPHIGQNFSRIFCEFYVWPMGIKFVWMERPTLRRICRSRNHVLQKIKNGRNVSIIANMYKFTCWCCQSAWESLFTLASSANVFLYIHLCTIPIECLCTFWCLGPQVKSSKTIPRHFYVHFKTLFHVYIPWSTQQLKSHHVTLSILSCPISASFTGKKKNSSCFCRCRHLK